MKNYEVYFTDECGAVWHKTYRAGSLLEAMALCEDDMRIHNVRILIRKTIEENW